MTSVEVLVPSANRLGEAPTWIPERSMLVWIDLLDPAVYCLSVRTGRLVQWTLKLATPLGAIVRTSNPDVVLLTHRMGISELNLSTRVISDYCDPEQGRDQAAYNDAKVDHRGRLWAGTSDLAETDPRGALWIVENRKRSYLADAGFIVANGPAFSSDGRTAYFNDSAARKTFAYDLVEGDHLPRKRRLLCTYEGDEGMPDGMTVDSEGCIWVAHWAGARVSRRDANGKVLAEIAVPSPNVTSVAFGGDDLGTLYITSAWEGLDKEGRAKHPQAGHLFACRPGVKGLEEPMFPLE